MFLPIEGFAGFNPFSGFSLWFAHHGKLINNVTTQRVCRDRGGGFEIFSKEVKEKAVFTEHFPLRETELFHKLPVIIIGHIVRTLGF